MMQANSICLVVVLAFAVQASSQHISGDVENSVASPADAPTLLRRVGNQLSLADTNDDFLPFGNSLHSMFLNSFFNPLASSFKRLPAAISPAKETDVDVNTSDKEDDGFFSSLFPALSAPDFFMPFGASSSFSPPTPVFDDVTCLLTVDLSNITEDSKLKVSVSNGRVVTVSYTTSKSSESDESNKSDKSEKIKKPHKPSELASPPKGHFLSGSFQQSESSFTLPPNCSADFDTSSPVSYNKEQKKLTVQFHPKGGKDSNEDNMVGEVKEVKEEGKDEVTGKDGIKEDGEVREEGEIREEPQQQQHSFGYRKNNHKKNETIKKGRDGTYEIPLMVLE